GIRGHFNDLITPEFVCKIGQSVGNLYDEVVVGWDARTTSPLLGNAMIAGLLAAGANVYVAGMITTPTLASAAKEYKCGIMLTASHNPATDNGVKFWNPDGSSFDSRQMEEVEDILLGEKIPNASWDKVGQLRTIDWTIDRHMERIMEHIPSLNAKVIVDCGNGASSTITPYLLRKLGCEVITINGHPDGSFPGRGSEPTKENTVLLAKAVVEMGATIGIAHDGDGDRTVAVDEKGNFADGDALMPLLCKLEGKTKVVVPINASMAVDRYLDGVEVLRCKVGDVYVSETIKQENADFGGEPSGTWVFPRTSYCPDGIFAAARLVQIAQERPLSEYLAEIPRFSVIRKRVDLPPATKAEAMKALGAGLKSKNPEEVSELDGFKAIYEKGWILLRPSGTEPKLKIVIEGDDDAAAKELFDMAMEIVEGVLN
ncbi:MAG: phosphoglucosamine mutase, partial [Thermoplasmata archaeon]|nr:phosphoglucosamine mutase [Thermoplasmata archaeon]